MTSAFIIAEVGSNWRNMKEAILCVELAAKSGADAVKFQWFSEYDLYGSGDRVRNFTKDQIEDLARVAERNKIEFMCTVFNDNLVYEIDPFVRRHKVASSEMGYRDLICNALDTDKPVIVSTGGQDFKAVRKLVDDVLVEKLFALMYCCNAYPSTKHDLRWIDVMRDEFACPVGYSDHSIDLFTPIVACDVYGARILEKHVKPFANMDTPDSGHSITFDDFRSVVVGIRDGFKMSFCNDEEQDAADYHNRRLVVTKPLNTGDAFHYNVNFGMYRTKEKSKGLGDEFIHLVHGCRAATGLKPGHVITSNDAK